MTEASNLLVDDDPFIGGYSAPNRTFSSAETAEQPIKNIIYYITFILIFLVVQGPN